MFDNIVLMLTGRHLSTSFVDWSAWRTDIMDSADWQTDITFVAVDERDAGERGVVHECVDLIVVDTHDDPETELEICRSLRDLYDDVPLLLVTCETCERHHVRAYLAGVDECVVRPISNKLLMAKVSAWLHFLHRNPSGRFFADPSPERGATIGVRGPELELLLQ